MPAQQYSNRGGTQSHDHDSGMLPTSVSEATTAMSDCVRDRPTESVLACFALGVVAGTFIGMKIIGSTQDTRSYQRRVAEGVGERIMSSLDRVLPESVSRQLGIHS
jgi:hypothetical protein